jgi:hypothetical protein
MQRLTYPFSLLAILMASIILAGSCAEDDLNDFEPCRTEYSYLNDVKPIIATNCAISGCHDGSLGTTRDWRNLSALQAKASNVSAFVRNGTMPPPSTGIELSAEEIQKISCWAQNGAKDN